MVVALHSSHGRIVLGRSVLSIGRGPQNTIALSADKVVSTRHAEIRLDSKGYVLVDLESTNGTYVNGKRIQPNEPIRLKIGDFIRIAITGFTVDMENSPSLDATVLLEEPLTTSFLSRFSYYPNRIVVMACAIALLIAAGLIDLAFKGLPIATLAAFFNVLALILILFV